MQKRLLRQKLLATFQTKGFSFEHPASLGLENGTVAVPGRPGFVYARLVNGVPVTAYNQANVPLQPDIQIKLAVTKEDPNFYVVLKQRDAYPSNATNIAQNNPANNANFQWPNPNAAFIYGQQFVPGLVAPVSGEVSVKVYGFVYWLNGSYHLLDNQTVDLSGHVPGSGAIWVLGEVDDTGAITLTDGSSVADKSLLTYTNIPAPDPSRIPIFAVRLYVGMTEVSWGSDTEAGDIVDLRWGLPGQYANDISYVPFDVSDWTSAVDPGDVQDALDELVLRTKNIEDIGADMTQAIYDMDGTGVVDDAEGLGGYPYNGSAPNDGDMLSYNAHTGMWEPVPQFVPLSGIADADGTLADATAKINAIISALESLGLLETV